MFVIGFLLDKKIGVNQPKRIENAKILIANTGMDTDKIKVCGLYFLKFYCWLLLTQESVTLNRLESLYTHIHFDMCVHKNDTLCYWNVNKGVKLNSAFMSFILDIWLSGKS